MSCDLLDKLSPLLSRGMVDTALKDAATMAMGSNRDTMFANSIKNKLPMVELAQFLSC